MDANDRELKFKITDEDRKRCGLSKQRALYYRYDAYDELVETIIQAKANVNERNNSGDTALTQAAVNGLTSTVMTLIAGNVDLKLKKGNGDTALHDAAKEGQGAILVCLMEAGADPHVRNNDAKTPIEVARTDEIAG